MSAENQLILVAIIVAVAIAVLGKASTPSVLEITSTDPLNTAPVGASNPHPENTHASAIKIIFFIVLTLFP